MDTTALEPAVAALRTAAGVFVVASVGNDGPPCATVDAPIALFDQSFTVGAYAEGGEPAPGRFQPDNCGDPAAHPNNYVGYGPTYAAVKAARQ